MKAKTSELTGTALDWAVGECEQFLWARYDHALHNDLPLPPRPSECLRDGYFRLGFTPSTNWAIGGPIIEREKISVVWSHWQWCAGTGDIGEIYRDDEGSHFTGTGPTPLIAAMRCYVTSKLGEEIELSDELH